MSGWRSNQANSIGVDQERSDLSAAFSGSVSGLFVVPKSDVEGQGVGSCLSAMDLARSASPYLPEFGDHARLPSERRPSLRAKCVSDPDMSRFAGLMIEDPCRSVSSSLEVSGTSTCVTGSRSAEASPFGAPGSQDELVDELISTLKKMSTGNEVSASDRGLMGSSAGGMGSSMSGPQRSRLTILPNAAAALTPVASGSCVSPTGSQSQLSDMGLERDPSGRTTVMLRNVPYDARQEGVRAVINAQGFAGLYDFFYAPLDFKTGNNLGYAFVNLLCSEAACVFVQTFDGLNLSSSGGGGGSGSHGGSLGSHGTGSLTSWTKTLKVGWAKVQGYAANVAHYQHSPVNRMPLEFRPMIFKIEPNSGASGSSASSSESSQVLVELPGAQGGPGVRLEWHQVPFPEPDENTGDSGQGASGSNRFRPERSGSGYERSSGGYDRSSSYDRSSGGYDRQHIGGMSYSPTTPTGGSSSKSSGLGFGSGSYGSGSSSSAAAAAALAGLPLDLLRSRGVSPRDRRLQQILRTKLADLGASIARCTSPQRKPNQSMMNSPLSPMSVSSAPRLGAGSGGRPSDQTSSMSGLASTMSGLGSSGSSSGSGISINRFKVVLTDLSPRVDSRTLSEAVEACGLGSQVSDSMVFRTLNGPTFGTLTFAEPRLVDEAIQVSQANTGSSLASQPHSLGTQPHSIGAQPLSDSGSSKFSSQVSRLLASIGDNASAVQAPKVWPSNRLTVV